MSFARARSPRTQRVRLSAVRRGAVCSPHAPASRKHLAAHGARRPPPALVTSAACMYEQRPPAHCHRLLPSVCRSQIVTLPALCPRPGSSTPLTQRTRSACLTLLAMLPWKRWPPHTPASYKSPASASSKSLVAVHITPVPQSCVTRCMRARLSRQAARYIWQPLATRCSPPAASDIAHFEHAAMRTTLQFARHTHAVLPSPAAWHPHRTAR